MRSAAFNTSAKVTAYHDNIMSPEKGVSFFRQFDLVANALDNIPTRRYVNRICLSLGKPLLESGTQGYSGQVYLIKGGSFECYECVEKNVPKTYPVCTIRDTPDKPVHCIAWAKLMFSSLFGPSGNDNELSDLKISRKKDESGENFGKRLFVYLFEETINDRLQKLDKSQVDNEDGEINSKTDSVNPQINENTKSFPKPLLLENLSKYTENDGNGSTEEEKSLPCDVNSIQNLISLKTQFIRSIKEIVSKKLEGKCVFDKDDNLAMDFVHSASSLRMENYGIKRISQFAAKGIAGNIVHAIATTNAVCAGLMAVQAEKILTERFICQKEGDPLINRIHGGLILLPNQSLPFRFDKIK